MDDEQVETIIASYGVGDKDDRALITLLLTNAVTREDITNLTASLSLEEQETRRRMWRSKHYSK